jgi:hypothetical protein
LHSRLSLGKLQLDPNLLQPHLLLIPLKPSAARSSTPRLSLCLLLMVLGAAADLPLGLDQQRRVR